VSWWILFLFVCDKHIIWILQAPDYATRIKRPMDFSTMRTKVDRHAYRSFDEFEDDFWLIVNNCKAYNEDGSLYYNLAAKLGSEVK
jgi:Bromodomain